MFYSHFPFHKIFGYACGTVACCSTFYYISWNTYYLEYRSQKIQCFAKKNVPTKMPEHLINLAISTVQDVSLANRKKKQIKFFFSKEDDVFAAGAYDNWTGVLIGIPETYAVSSVDEIKKEAIKLEGGRKINWEEGPGQKLLSTFVMSDDAKKYALVRKLYELDSFRLYIQVGMLAIIPMAPSLALEYFMEQNPALFKKNPKYSVYVAAVSCLLAAMSFTALDNYLDEYYEKDGIERAANVKRPQYLVGGIEYHNKLRERNRMWRKLLGEKGKKLYTKEGNKISFFKKFTETEKIDLLEKIAKLNQVHLQDAVQLKIN